MTDPRFAPRRQDLPYLRRRRRPRPAEPISFDRPERHHVAAPAPARPEAAPAPSPPAPSPPAPPPVPAPSPLPAPPVPTSLDLDEPVPLPPAAASTSLDLDGQSAPAPAPFAPAPAEPERRLWEDLRVGAGARLILSTAQPTVTLTRMQSAIGTLTFEAACSDEVGDLRIGAAYQLRSGLSSTVQLIGGHRLGPPRSRRPVLVASRDRFGEIAVDLRQSRELERLGLYAFSESRRPLNWGGTLVAETCGGARVEVPLEPLHGGEVAMLMTLYNVRGEFVLRAELQSFAGDVREACRAFGFDQITWLDDRTPVD